MTNLAQIITDNIQGIYQSYEYIIPPKGIKPLNSVYDFFTCIEANHPFNIRFSSSAGYTQFEQGLYVRFGKTLDYLLIQNPADTPLVIKFGIGCGEFKDNRLTVTTTVKTEPALYPLFNVETLTIPEGGSIALPIHKKIIIQNTGDNIMYIGGTGTDGLQLQPQGTFEYETEQAVTVYGTATDTLAVGEFD